MSKTPESSAKQATVFELLEAIVDSPGLTAEQKCLLVKIRCRVNSRTMSGAIVRTAGLMRAASVRSWRTLQRHLRGLTDTYTVTVTERSGKASVYALTQERMAAIRRHPAGGRRQGDPDSAVSYVADDWRSDSCSGVHRGAAAHRERSRCRDGAAAPGERDQGAA